MSVQSTDRKTSDSTLLTTRQVARVWFDMDKHTCTIGQHKIFNISS